SPRSCSQARRLFAASSTFARAPVNMCSHASPPARSRQSHHFDLVFVMTTPPRKPGRAGAPASEPKITHRLGPFSPPWPALHSRRQSLLTVAVGVFSTGFAPERESPGAEGCGVGSRTVVWDEPHGRSGAVRFASYTCGTHAESFRWWCVFRRLEHPGRRAD